MERYVYTNPSAEQWQNEVIRTVHDGVTCRVENLPADLCAPEEGHFSRESLNEVTMRTRSDTARSPGEEGVRFLLDTEEPPTPTVTPNRGMIRVSSSKTGILRVPSSFGNFEQLFQDVEEFPYPLPLSYGRQESDKGFYSDDPPESPNEQPEYKRQDSSHARMSRNSLRALVRESWENTGSFASFQRRLAPNLNDKYCMRLNIHATIFMFIYVVYGATLLTMATFTWNRSEGVDNVVGAYLIVTGLLSVFIFPIMIMEWSPRIGGCLDEESAEGKPYYFSVALFLRLCACVAGTVCVYYRYPAYHGPKAEPGFEAHKYEFLAVAVSVCIDWFVLFLTIVLPTGCYLCCYCCARTSLCKPRSKVLKHDKLKIINYS